MRPSSAQIHPAPCPLGVFPTAIQPTPDTLGITCGISLADSTKCSPQSATPTPIGMTHVPFIEQQRYIRAASIRAPLGAESPRGQKTSPSPAPSSLSAPLLPLITPAEQVLAGKTNPHSRIDALALGNDLVTNVYRFTSEPPVWPSGNSTLLFTAFVPPSSFADHHS